MDTNFSRKFEKSKRSRRHAIPGGNGKRSSDCGDSTAGALALGLGTDGGNFKSDSSDSGQQQQQEENPIRLIVYYLQKIEKRLGQIDRRVEKIENFVIATKTVETEKCPPTDSSRPPPDPDDDDVLVDEDQRQEGEAPEDLEEDSTSSLYVSKDDFDKIQEDEDDIESETTAKKRRLDDVAIGDQEEEPIGNAIDKTTVNFIEVIEPPDLDLSKPSFEMHLDERNFPFDEDDESPKFEHISKLGSNTVAEEVNVMPFTGHEQPESPPFNMNSSASQTYTSIKIESPNEMYDNDMPLKFQYDDSEDISLVAEYQYDDSIADPDPETTINTEDDKVAFELPCKTTEHLDQLEDTIANARPTYAAFVDFLRTLNDDDHAKFIRNCLNVIFDRNLAVFYNWSGKGERSKKAVSDMSIMKAVQDASNILFGPDTNKCTIKTIMRWFRYGDQRLSGRHKHEDDSFFD